MIKSVKHRVWAFDLEWVPDPVAGRLLYDVPDKITDPADVMGLMWERGGATEEDPTPFLKTALCRVVSVAALERRERRDGTVSLNLMSLPHDPNELEQVSEANVVGTFLEALGSTRPQLVGFNSLHSDLKILIQRGIILGLAAPGFCERPEKPWEGIDYFARGSGYNECDALTAYLVWLRMAHFAGHFDDQSYTREQQLVVDLLQTEAAKDGHKHLADYLENWQRLRETVENQRIQE
jgi:predicted PolB exonuclease-like 3'-5' exonuclease